MDNIRESEDKVFDKNPQSLPIGHENSHLFVCGKNENFELTFKNISHIPTPLGSEFGVGKEVVQVSIRDNHSAFLTSEHELFLCGSNLCNKLGFVTSSQNVWKPKKL